eukprot:TRINITY_DN18892_c0_g1_i1.p1 TRINITY_DN18892_c0_g1~~TRINITY_DN18892_c0_g1_i1.p1  ORF type:complete len:157 (+),score=10.68 TRINITY_DN18892_c0_g1_i1:60-530(+)
MTDSSRPVFEMGDVNEKQENSQPTDQRILGEEEKSNLEKTNEDYDKDLSDKSLEDETVKSRQLKFEDLVSEKDSDERHKRNLCLKAAKLRKHYKELEACDKVMGYGFIVILFFCAGFMWFIKMFGPEIKTTFSAWHVIAPAFIYGSVILGTLNILL